MKEKDMSFVKPGRARGGKSVNNTQSTLVEDFDGIAAGTWIVPESPFTAGWLTIEPVYGHAVVAPITEQGGNQLSAVQGEGGGVPLFLGLAFSSRPASAVIIDLFSPAAGVAIVQLYDRYTDNPDESTFLDKTISLTKGRNLIQESHPQGLRIEAVGLFSEDLHLLVLDNLTLIGV
ncbi:MULTISPECIES: hypothetical protein [unclassified Luteibacter]|uniref:hypothetical protein n=1 Tax=unclassified Luteibacter TaxID=2620188 RepID=UPI00055C7B7E|nr:hypothetical protein [Luteibacter sp. 9135]